MEADDAVVARKDALPDKYILCAVDKDVLYSLEGTHFNYYTSVKYDIDMKWIEVGKDQAMKHHFTQVLTGDPGDNVIGLHGIGPKKADKILADCTTPDECWKAVREAYEENGRNIIDAIINMRLVSMNQVKYYPETDSYKLKLYGKDEYERCE
jgi:5'-3' exonuclease